MAGDLRLLRSRDLHRCVAPQFEAPVLNIAALARLTLARGANRADYDGVWRVWGTVDPRSGDWHRRPHRVKREQSERVELRRRWPLAARPAAAGQLLERCWLNEFEMQPGDDHSFCHCLRVNSAFVPT